LLRLFECIESIKSDVKKKMMLTSAYDPCTKVTEASETQKISSNDAAVMFSKRQSATNSLFHAHDAKETWAEEFCVRGEFLIAMRKQFDILGRGGTIILKAKNLRRSR
jgi:hypothetical protein